MAVQLAAHRIRFAIDASNPMGQQPINVLNNRNIELPSGTSLQLELMFYFQALADNTLLDLTQFSQINIAFQDNADPHSGTVYYTGSVASANFVAASTANWLAGSAQQVTLNITSAQNVVPPASSSWWLVIYGVSTDANADNVLLLACNINGRDSGIPTGASGLGAGFKAGTKLSFVCGDGLTRDLQIAAGPGGIWVTAINQVGYNGPGQAVFSLYCADGHWRDISLQNQSGNYVLAVNPNGHS